MEQDRNIIETTIDWQGIALSISYEYDWLNMARSGGRHVAHLQIRSIAPACAPLPVTETGYRSHFVNPDDIEAEGGHVGYVVAWLNHAAETPEWRERQDAGRQMSLF